MNIAIYLISDLVPKYMIITNSALSIQNKAIFFVGLPDDDRLILSALQKLV